MKILPAPAGRQAEQKENSMSTTETYDVMGMTCDHCARAVTAEIGALEGVADVHVDVKTGTVEVTTDRALPTQQVRQAVEEAGYTLA